MELSQVSLFQPDNLPPFYVLAAIVTISAALLWETSSLAIDALLNALTALLGPMGFGDTMVALSAISAVTGIMSYFWSSLVPDAMLVPLIAGAAFVTSALEIIGMTVEWLWDETLILQSLQSPKCAAAMKATIQDLFLAQKSEKTTISDAFKKVYTACQGK